MARRIDAWGHPQRHYANPDTTAASEPVLDEQWAQTIGLVAPECATRVKRTVHLWNQKVRNQLASEIGFQLRRRHIPVRVHDGLPMPLWDILGGVDGLELIVLNQSLLRAVVDGTRFMEGVRERVRARDGTIVGPAAPREIRMVRQTAEAWLALARNHDLGKALRKVREDVLGAYFVRQQEVRIYWQAIGVFAALYGVSVEPLAVVVLAHELAHAYTHLGFDIDGYDWPTERFVSTDIAIVEGLAQFYAEVVCKNLEDQIPDAIVAFRTLLAEQNEIYRTHRSWVDEDDRNSGEIVRVSLLECRRAGRTMHRDDFAETVIRRRHEITGM